MTDLENVKRGRNSKARSKSVEREVAHLVGGQRIPDGVGHGDVQNTGCVFECKSHQRPSPKRRLEAWAQAEHAAEVTGKDPALVETYIDGGKRTFWLIVKMEAAEA